MSAQAVVRCSSCAQPSRVPAEALGLVVACPRCGWEFVAVDTAPQPPRREPIPTVFSARARPAPPPPKPTDDDPPTVHSQTTEGAGVPVAVALLPLGVPLLWLALSLAVGPSEFSFMAPVAIAVGTVLLGLGVATLGRWSTQLRVGVLAVLVSLAYTSAGVFYFARPEWLERVREVAVVWGWVGREYRPDDRTFKLEVPGEPKDAPSPLPGWKPTAKQFGNDKNPTDVYLLAYGPPPAEWGGKSDDTGFGKAKEAIAAATGGSVKTERVVSLANAQAREYVVELPENRQRVVRVVWAGAKVYYLAVEGLYVSGERLDVKHYLGSFSLTPKGR